MIDKVMNEMKDVAAQLWKCDEGAYQQLSECMDDWQRLLQEMINRMCQWVKEGKEIPLDIVLCQIENFEVALSRKDSLMLADVLNFEFGETLKYYKGLLETYDGK